MSWILEQTNSLSHSRASRDQQALFDRFVTSLSPLKGGIHRTITIEPTWISKFANIIAKYPAVYGHRDRSQRENLAFGMLSKVAVEAGFRLQNDEDNRLARWIEQFRSAHPISGTVLEWSAYFITPERGDSIGLTLAAIPGVGATYKAERLIQKSVTTKVTTTLIHALEEAVNGKKISTESAFTATIRELSQNGWDVSRLAAAQQTFVRDLALNVLFNRPEAEMRDAWNISARSYETVRSAFMRMILEPEEALRTLGASAARVRLFHALIEKHFFRFDEIMAYIPHSPVTLRLQARARRILLEALQGASRKDGATKFGLTTTGVKQAVRTSYKSLGVSEACDTLLITLKAGIFSLTDFAKASVPEVPAQLRRVKISPLSTKERSLFATLSTLGDVEALVFQHLVQGLSPKDSAGLIGNAPRTVSGIRRVILRKLELTGAPGAHAAPTAIEIFREMSRKLFGDPAYAPYLVDASQEFAKKRIRDVLRTKPK